MNSIFISSSFRDMQYERDAIRYLALPKINEYLRENYGQETSIVDLRWGIDTSDIDEESGMKKIVRTCLYEIEGCKPFMIVLLGDRYGTSIEPREYISGFDCSRYESIGVTELEVRYALNLAKQGKMHVLFYFRDMDYSTVDDSVKKSVFFDAEQREEKQLKLLALKNELINLFPANCRSYPASWDPKNRKMIGMSELSDLIFSDITMCVRKELGEPHKTPILIDDAFAKSKRLSFVGRQADLSAIDVFLGDKTKDIAIMYGSMGTGKSSLIANLEKLQTKCEVISVFCGQGNSSDTAIGIVRNIVSRLYQIMDKAKEAEDVSSWSFNEWHEEMDRLIGMYISNHDLLVIAIDAVDQMVQDLGTRKLLFLPYSHNGKVKVILTAVDDYKFEESLPSLEKATYLHLSSPSNGEIERVVDGIWLKYGKPSVSEVIKTSLLKKPLAGNYLYVNLMLARLMFIGKEVFDNKDNGSKHIVSSIKKVIDLFPDALDAAAAELLNTMGRTVNPELSELVFDFLRLSRNGLRATDLFELCGSVFVSADFYILKRLLGTFIFERADHRFDFTHKVFRSIADDPSKDLCQRYLNYTATLPGSDPLAVEYRLHAAIVSHNADSIYRCIIDNTDNHIAKIRLAEQLSNYIDESIHVTEELLGAFHVNSSVWPVISFFAEHLQDSLAQSRNSKRLIDGISSVLENALVLKELSDYELHTLVVFEEKHFISDCEYYGYRQCDTNRYYLCLREMERRHPTIENKVKTVSHELEYEAFWNPIEGKYVLTASKEERAFKTYSIINRSIKQFEKENSNESVILTAKALIKRADLEFKGVHIWGDERIPAYVPDNEKAKASIEKALDLIKQVSTRLGLKAKLRMPFDRSCLLGIAQCYCNAARILMKTSAEGSLYAAALAKENNTIAYEYLEKAHNICLLIQNGIVHDDYLSVIMEIIYAQSYIISKGWYIKGQDIEKAEKRISDVMEHIEQQMYLVLQSQKLCGMYARLCGMRSDVIRGSIHPMRTIYDVDDYPWSEVSSREENCCLYTTLEKVYYWADRTVALYKYLFITYPNPGSAADYIDSLRSRIGILKYYKYRSMRTIINASEDDDYGSIIPDKKDEMLDAQELREREFSKLVELCYTLSSSEYHDKKTTDGVFVIVAKRVFFMYPYFTPEFILGFQEQLFQIEETYVQRVRSAIDEKNQDLVYALDESRADLDKLMIGKRKDVKELKRQYDSYIKQNNTWNYSSETYRNLLWDWDEAL